MKKNCLLFLLTWMFINISQAQLSIGERLTLGGSLTYIPNNAASVPAPDRVHEWTFNTNISTSITKRISFGLSGLFIRTYFQEEQSNYNLFGAFTQYSILDTPHNRFFGELGLYLGDYCTCGTNTPYSTPNLKYLSFGGGYEWKFSPRLHIEAGFIVYRIINEPERIYGYTQYILGLNYQISK